MTVKLIPRTILIFTLLLIVICCKNSPLSNKKYNVFKEKINIESDFINTFSGFDINKTADDSITEQDPKYAQGLRRMIGYSFKSSKPVRKDQSGNYYYRWSLSVKIFDSYQSAVGDFNRQYDMLGNSDPVDRKGANQRMIIRDNAIFKISAGCLEGRHVGEWFEKLLTAIIGSNDPEENTILISSCGGNITLE